MLWLMMIPFGSLGIAAAIVLGLANFSPSAGTTDLPLFRLLATAIAPVALLMGLAFTRQHPQFLPLVAGLALTAGAALYFGYGSLLLTL